MNWLLMLISLLGLATCVPLFDLWRVIRSINGRLPLMREMGGFVLATFARILTSSVAAFVMRDCCSMGEKVVALTLLALASTWQIIDIVKLRVAIGRCR